MKTAILAFLISFASVFSAQADVPSVHGMLMFGDKKLYASHLPMFHAPHDYQLILEISVNSSVPNSAAQYTLEPQIMDLSKVISGEITSFQAHLYEGHFEKGGINLGSIQVNVEKIIYSKKLDANEKSSRAKYILFGGEGEYFAAHVIQGQPSFDQIVEISQPNKGRSSFCRTRTCEPEPIQVPLLDSNLPLQLNTGLTMDQALQLQSESFLGAFYDVNTTVKKVIYSEASELSH